MTTKVLLALTLGAAVIFGGCAAHRVETPRAAPKSTPVKPPSKPRQAEPRAAAPGESGAPETSSPTAEMVPAQPTAERAPQAKAPGATESVYVFAPQQAAVASAPAGPSRVPAPASAPRPTAPPTAPPGDAPEETTPPAPGRLQLSVIASTTEIATGAIMTVDVMASSSHAVVDAPLHLTFDPSVVEFVDGTVGDFLAQGGSSVVFFADGRTNPGDVAVAAGRVDRGQGASGAGLLCRVRLRGVAQGTTAVAVGRARAWGVGGDELVVSSAGTTAVVR